MRGLPQVVDLQFWSMDNQKVGGPIIAVQIENEYGNFGYGNYPRQANLVPLQIHYNKSILVRCQYRQS